MGAASRQSYAATFPPDRFYCLLDELPLHLIPRHGLTSLYSRDNATLFLNPNCVFCSQGELPDDLEDDRDLLAGFAWQGTVVWVREPNGARLLPFWLGPRLQEALQRIQAGDVQPSGLPEDMRAVLLAAGIVTSADHADARHRHWQKIVQKARPDFREKGYAPPTSLIHPFHTAALRRYYRYLIRTRRIGLGDGQSSLRYVAYNDPVARFFHRQLAVTLSAVAGEPLKPSYVYMASYLSGAELKKHTDREQCEFSITLCLDFSPEPDLETPWPIRLDTPSGSVTVHQALGDGLAYRGTKLPHYRDVLGEGKTSTSIFFHYVAADFVGSLD